MQWNTLGKPGVWGFFKQRRECSNSKFPLSTLLTWIFLRMLYQVHAWNVTQPLVYFYANTAVKANNWNLHFFPHFQCIKQLLILSCFVTHVRLLYQSNKAQVILLPAWIHLQTSKVDIWISNLMFTFLFSSVYWFCPGRNKNSARWLQRNTPFRIWIGILLQCFSVRMVWY